MKISAVLIPLCLIGITGCNSTDTAFFSAEAYRIDKLTYELSKADCPDALERLKAVRGDREYITRFGLAALEDEVTACSKRTSMARLDEEISRQRATATQ